MGIQLDTKYLGAYAAEETLAGIAPEVKNAYKLVRDRSGAGHDFLGWVDLPVNYDRAEFDRILAAAEKIKRSCDLFIVIGIGGSYLGARAAIEFIKSPLYNTMKKDTPDIYFAGKDLSSEYMTQLLTLCRDRDVCINVISKSGTTTEPAIAFRLMREVMVQKYGKEGARERIFITTDARRGKLHDLAVQEGYETFVVPDDVGGRYSVLTAVGLLPIAVSGADISVMMKGAQDAREAYYLGSEDNDCAKYAAIRNLLYRDGKAIELFACYDPSLTMMGEWWKQLYGESEGKDGKGLFPASVTFSTDLHSLGQIIQDGVRNLFETVVTVEEDRCPLVIPDDPENADGLNFLSGKTVEEVCSNAFLATVLSHTDGGVPNLVLHLAARDAYHFGCLVYFYEMACALSGYMLGVNPFNQPGVEGYKKNMFALLGKPGAENEKRFEEITARMLSLR